MTDVTQILGAMEQGDPKAADQLLPLVYHELRNLAVARMSHEIPGHTLQPTALVHEAWLRLVEARQHTWQNRAHFFSAAAEAMRRILIDHARRKQRLKHGGGKQRVDLDDCEISAPDDAEKLLAVNEALEHFASVEPQKAELVKLRYFAGLPVEEAAQILKISTATANRWWAFSRAVLYQEIKRQQNS